MTRWTGFRLETDGVTHLLSLDDIASEFRYGLSQARKVTAQPDFPAPVRLWDGAHPRWIAREVLEWAEGKKEAA